MFHMIEKYIYINNFVSHSFVFMSIFQKYNRSVSCTEIYHIFNPYIIVIHVVIFNFQLEFLKCILQDN